jgi:23S rRNA (adenine2503-C2)-methyltransferase
MSSEMNTTAPKTDIKDLTRQQLAAWLEERQIQAYRASQILKWIYIRQADTFDEMTDLKKDVRNLISQHFSIDRLGLQAIETSNDGSRKYLFRLRDGNRIESVLIPERDHYTLCISSQVGCALGCRFCLTGKGGLIRNLSCGEIISQVRDVMQHGKADRPLTNIVFMGMGEPLSNYRAVVDAISVITDNDCGLKFAGRRVTLSTAGLVDRMLELGRETRVNLAVSLNATENKTRSRLMPINDKYPLETLLDGCRRYPLIKGRKITFEYILIQGLNDTLEDARRLAGLLAPIKAKINLIPFNEHPGCQFKRPTEETILAFQEILLNKHYTAIVRHSKGQDISAACGQLRCRAANEFGAKTATPAHPPQIL